jgi:group I intron endonuclease
MIFNAPKEDRDRWGIYIITNTIDQRVYIGQTSNFYKRYLKHRADLNAGEHLNLLLQNFVDEHSLDCLEFKILERTPFTDERETYYIKMYKSIFVGFGFNLARSSIQLNEFGSEYRLNSHQLRFTKKAYREEIKRLEYLLSDLREQLLEIQASNEGKTEEHLKLASDAALYKKNYDSIATMFIELKQKYEALVAYKKNRIKVKRKPTTTTLKQYCLFEEDTEKVQLA